MWMDRGIKTDLDIGRASLLINCLEKDLGRKLITKCRQNTLTT